MKKQSGCLQKIMKVVNKILNEEKSNKKKKRQKFKAGYKQYYDRWFSHLKIPETTVRLKNARSRLFENQNKYPWHEISPNKNKVSGMKKNPFKTIFLS